MPRSRRTSPSGGSRCVFFVGSGWIFLQRGVWTSVAAKTGKATEGEEQSVRRGVCRVSEGMSTNEPLGCDGQLSSSGKYFFLGTGKRTNANPAEEVGPPSEERDAKRVGSIVERTAWVGKRETNRWEETNRVLWEWLVEAIPRGRVNKGSGSDAAKGFGEGDFGKGDVCD